MTKKFLLLNIVLIGLLATAIWQIRLRWLQYQSHEVQTLNHKPPQAAPPALPAAAPVAPIQAGAYVDVAQRTLFAADRNPTVVIERPPEKPVPPFPEARGVMDLGAGATIIFSEKNGNQKGYHAGDKVGPFLLASLNTEEVVFEWEGKQFKKNINELKPKAVAEAPAAASTTSSMGEGYIAPRNVPNEVTPKEKVEEAQKINQGGPGIDVNGPMRVCAPGDSAPVGAIVSGYRKVVTRTPFSTACYWEPVK